MLMLTMLVMLMICVHSPPLFVHSTCVNIVASNQGTKDRYFVAKTPKVKLVQTSTPWT
jgi:hypothetical protein